MDRARLVVTDSGGVQEETTVLRVPCLTVRDNTERAVTIRDGTNQLVGVNPAAMLTAARETLSGRGPSFDRVPELWDGRAGPRIAADLVRWLRPKRALVNDRAADP
jgi:UDP-N-acetylglucosamine 2-epimerase (non-hydrolysing)